MTVILVGPVFVVGMILIMRRIFRNTLSMRHRYRLWLMGGILLFFFLISTWADRWLPENRFSIFTAAEWAEGQLLTAYPQAAPLINQLETGQVYVDRDSDFFLVRAAGFDWQLIFFCIWWLGAGVFTVLIWRMNRRLQKEILAARVPLQKKSSMTFPPEWGALPIYLVKELSSPCLIQIQGQVAIYLPDQIMEDPGSVRHAVAHELCHDRRKDLRWNALRMELLALYWFHPLVWLGAYLSRQDCELACDESAIELLGESERYAYGRTLLTLVGKAAGISDVLYSGTFMTSHAGSLKQRIRQIARRYKTSAFATFAFYCLLSGLLMVSLGKAEGGNGPTAQAIVEDMGKWSAWKESLILKESVAEARLRRLQAESLLSEDGDRGKSLGEDMAHRMAAYLVENHLKYVGDHVSSSRIVGTCIRSVGVDALGSVELQTAEEPYAYRSIFRTEAAKELPLEDIRAVSILMFASIENLGVLEIYEGEDGIHKDALLLRVTRQEAMEAYGIRELGIYGESAENMKELVKMVQEKL